MQAASPETIVPSERSLLGLNVRPGARCEPSNTLQDMLSRGFFPRLPRRPRVYVSAGVKCRPDLIAVIESGGQSPQLWYRGYWRLVQVEGARQVDITTDEVPLVELPHRVEWQVEVKA